MKAALVTSAVALVAMASLALAQTQKGEPGQMKEPPPSAGTGKMEKEAAPGEKAGPGKQTGEKAEKKEMPEATPKSEKGGKAEVKESTKEPGQEKAASPKAGGEGAKLSEDQRTKVQSAFAKHKVKSANVNISVRVGVAVPRTVEFYPIPEEIVIIVPAYRRYRYFVVGNSICIVDPDTFVIVEIIVIA